ncbi:MAG: SDR family NAD(P)-dependent oxidoreductase, partial [Geodermatophilaceae bacterium]
MGERRTCLVTGGGRGIGRAVALQLSALGHRVALTARNAEQLTETAALLSGPTMTHPADITDDDA